MAANKQELKTLIEELRAAGTVPALMSFINSWDGMYREAAHKEEINKHLAWEIEDAHSASTRSADAEGNEIGDLGPEEINANALKIIYAAMTIGYLAGAYGNPDMASVFELIMGALTFLSQEIGLEYWMRFDGDTTAGGKITPKFVVALSQNTTEHLVIYYKRPAIA